MTQQSQTQKVLFDSWLEKETKRIKDGAHQAIDSGAQITFDCQEHSSSKHFDITEYHIDWTIKHTGRKAVEAIAKVTSDQARLAE